MAYEHKEGQGALFSNDKKGNDRAPDMRGDALINGVLCEVAAWRKEGQRGPFYSLQIKPKQDRPAAPSREPASRPAPSGGVADMESDIPF